MAITVPLARSVGIQPMEAKTDNHSGDSIIHRRPMSTVLHHFTEGFPPLHFTFGTRRLRLSSPRTNRMRLRLSGGYLAG